MYPACNQSFSRELMYVDLECVRDKWPLIPDCGEFWGRGHQHYIPVTGMVSKGSQLSPRVSIL